MSGTVRWEDVKRPVREQRLAEGLPVESEAEEREAMAKLRAEIRACRLVEMRRELALTQKEVAAAMGVSAPRVSAIEKGDLEHVEVATLRSYVEALGGSLRVVAHFGDAEYTVA